MAEGGPVPTAVAVPIEPAETPIVTPTPEIVIEPTAMVDKGEVTGGAPRFVLPSAQGGQVSLDEYLERGNVVLVFYRAFW